MAIDYNLIEVTVDAAALAANYRRLAALGTDCAAVVKSDGYGHGLAACARAFTEAGAKTLAVGTVGEAAALRETPFHGPLIALLGAQNAAECCEAVERDIIPFTGRLEQIEMLAEAAAARPGNGPARIAVKCDTGMGRLGFAENEIPALLAALEKHAGAIEPVLLASHLAAADEPASKAFTEEQNARFLRFDAALRAAGHAPARTLANTAALLGHPALRHDLQRPGIGLYGANPFHGTEWAHLGADLVPAMSVSAPILQVHPLAKGTPIHYGRTYVAERDMRVAIVAAGHADCWSRGLSSNGQAPRGQMAVHGVRAPILGRVCMQMSAVDVTDIPDVAPGERAYLLGGPGHAVTAEELAAWWGTITYEVFCLLGMNPRRYA